MRSESARLHIDHPLHPVQKVENVPEPGGIYTCSVRYIRRLGEIYVVDFLCIELWKVLTEFPSGGDDTVIVCVVNSVFGGKKYVAQSELGHMPRCIYSYTNPQNFGITTLGNYGVPFVSKFNLQTNSTPRLRLAKSMSTFS